MKEGGVYSHNGNKFNKTNMLSAKTSREVKKYTEYPPHQMIRFGPSRDHIAISNPNIDVTILAQGYWGVIVTLFLV